MCKKVLILIIALVSVIPINASAVTLNVFTSNYDADVFKTEKINFNVDPSIPQNWYPLKAVSEYLPIDVSWDSKTREVVIDNFPLQQMNPNIQAFRYKTNRVPDSLRIKNGVTYCSPNLLSYLLHGVGFRYNGEVYCFDGESVQSDLINPGASKFFKDSTITSMYQMKLKMPDEYKFVRKYLPGGISCVKKDSNTAIPSNTLGYVYPNAYKPCCYVVGDKLTGTSLASLIAHESYHVYQYKSGKNVDEVGADRYEKMIKSEMIAMN